MNDHVDDAAVTDTAPADEVGHPAERIKRCDMHDVLYETGGRCLRCERDEPAQTERERRRATTDDPHAEQRSRQRVIDNAANQGGEL